MKKQKIYEELREILKQADNKKVSNNIECEIAEENLFDLKENINDLARKILEDIQAVHNQLLDQRRVYGHLLSLIEENSKTPEVFKNKLDELETKFDNIYGGIDDLIVELRSDIEIKE